MKDRTRKREGETDKDRDRQGEWKTDRQVQKKKFANATDSALL